MGAPMENWAWTAAKRETRTTKKFIFVVDFGPQRPFGLKGSGDLAPDGPKTAHGKWNHWNHYQLS